MGTTYKLENIKFAEHPTSKRFEDLTGRQFNFLTVIGFAGVISNVSQWFCKCQCGNITRSQAFHLKQAAVKSCGCVKSPPVFRVYTAPKVKHVDPDEPQTFYDSKEYAQACNQVFEFIRDKAYLTIGCVARRFDAQKGSDIGFPLLDVLDTLRKDGLISFERKGLITWITLEGEEIKPSPKFERNYWRNLRIK